MGERRRSPNPTDSAPFEYMSPKTRCSVGEKTSKGNVGRASLEFPGSEKCLVQAEFSGSATREKMVVVAGVTKRPLSARDEVADSPFGISISLARDTKKREAMLCLGWQKTRRENFHLPFCP